MRGWRGGAGPVVAVGGLRRVPCAHLHLHAWHGARRSLLEWREQWLGPGAVLSPTRFLYHTVGPVYLIRWSQVGAGAQHAKQKKTSWEHFSVRAGLHAGCLGELALCGRFRPCVLGTQQHRQVQSPPPSCKPAGARLTKPPAPCALSCRQDSGHSVLPLDADELEQHLALDVQALRSQPLRLAQVGLGVVLAVLHCTAWHGCGHPLRRMPGGRDLLGSARRASWLQGSLSPLRSHSALTATDPPIPAPCAQAILDHHHGNYAQELRAAASALARKQQQRQQVQGTSST